ncbi:MAG: hypothetical protein VZQ98_12305 [Bacteroidales bacterium]|jgi:hypothetical protein|nr:hypothetical protein [Bacteroidales bacterium]
MGAKITPAQARRKDYAKILYVQGFQSATEIGEKLWTKEGQSDEARARAIHAGEVVVRKWIKEGAWDELRTSLSITRDANLKNLYQQISTITNNIAKREPDERVATKEEAEMLSKLADIISKLEAEIGISEIVNTGMQFIDWIRSHDIGAAKEVCTYWDEFLKFKMCG